LRDLLQLIVLSYRLYDARARFGIVFDQSDARQ
jgi:hypothetical protein